MNCLLLRHLNHSATQICCEMLLVPRRMKRGLHLQDVWFLWSIASKTGRKQGFHCSSCGLVADRDQHAARNIWFKYLTDCHAHGAAEMHL